MVEFFTQLSIMILSSIGVTMYMAKVKSSSGFFRWIKARLFWIFQLYVIFGIVSVLLVTTEYDVFTAFTTAYGLPAISLGGSIGFSTIVSAAMLRR